MKKLANKLGTRKTTKMHNFLELIEENKDLIRRAKKSNKNNFVQIYR